MSPRRRCYGRPSSDATRGETAQAAAQTSRPYFRPLYEIVTRHRCRALGRGPETSRHQDDKKLVARPVFFGYRQLYLFARQLVGFNRLDAKKARWARFTAIADLEKRPGPRQGRSGGGEDEADIADASDAGRRLVGAHCNRHQARRATLQFEDEAQDAHSRMAAPRRLADSLGWCLPHCPRRSATSTRRYVLGSALQAPPSIPLRHQSYAFGKRESSRPRRRPLFYHHSSRAPVAARLPRRRRRTREESRRVATALAAGGGRTTSRAPSPRFVYAKAARRLQRSLSAPRGRMRCFYTFVC